MILTAGNNLIVEFIRVPEKGTPWQVSVYKKVFGFKRRISCDWFLDEDQARKFAEQLAKQLHSNDSLEALRKRNPGWSLNKPAR